jgi:hypothetical protein
MEAHGLRGVHRAGNIQIAFYDVARCIGQALRAGRRCAHQDGRAEEARAHVRSPQGGARHTTCCADSLSWRVTRLALEEGYHEGWTRYESAGVCTKCEFRVKGFSVCRLTHVLSRAKISQGGGVAFISSA